METVIALSYVAYPGSDPVLINKFGTILSEAARIALDHTKSLKDTETSFLMVHHDGTKAIVIVDENDCHYYYNVHALEKV